MEAWWEGIFFCEAEIWENLTFILRCVHVCVCAQSCPTLWDLMDCSLPRFSVYGIFQARILEWVVISSSRGSSRPRIELESLGSPALAGGSFTTWGQPSSSPRVSSEWAEQLRACQHHRAGEGAAPPCASSPPGRIECLRTGWKIHSSSQEEKQAKGKTDWKDGVGRRRVRGANGKEEKQALLFALLPLGLRVGQSPGCRSRWPEHPLCSVMALTHGGVCPLEADCYVTLEDSSPGNLGLSKSLGQREGIIWIEK